MTHVLPRPAPVQVTLLGACGVVKHLLAPLLLLAACSSPAPQPIRYCVDARLRAPAESAAERWSAAAGLWIAVDSTCDPGDGRIGVGDTGRAWGRGGVATDKHTAWAAIDPSKLDLDAVQLESLVVHELGHSLGAEHHTDGPGIMRPGSEYPGLEITEHDLASLCAVAECTAWDPEDK